MQKYLRAKQMEEEYGIDKVTIWRWTKNPAKKFPQPIRVSATISLYDAVAVRKWFKRMAITPANQAVSRAKRR